MNADFRLIQDLSEFLRPMGIPWFVSGGWAIDVHLGRITRDRCDLDISVPNADRMACLSFFLDQDWQIEGKLGGGFKTIQTLTDYQNDIHYFWSFPQGVDFIGEYIDEDGNRRIDYQRETQTELDYIEVFFDHFENENFLYRREPDIKRTLEQAILAREGIRYLAPEVVLLFKSATLSEKNNQDFEAVVDTLVKDAADWLIQALHRTGRDAHPWLGRLQGGG